MTELLCLLLKPALLCVSDPKRYWYLTPVAVLAWLVDVLLAHSFWMLVSGGWPKKGEYTISDSLERLCVTPTSDLFLFIEISKKINRVAGYKHIKVV